MDWKRFMAPCLLPSRRRRGVCLAAELQSCDLSRKKKKEKAGVQRLQRRVRWALLRALLAMGEPLVVQAIGVDVVL